MLGRVILGFNVVILIVCLLKKFYVFFGFIYIRVFCDVYFFYIEIKVKFVVYFVWICYIRDEFCNCDNIIKILILKEKF